MRVCVCSRAPPTPGATGSAQWTIVLVVREGEYSSRGTRRHRGRPHGRPGGAGLGLGRGGRDLRTVVSCRPEVDRDFCCLAVGLGHHRRGVARDHRPRPGGDLPAATDGHHDGRGPLGPRLHRAGGRLRRGAVRLPAGHSGPGVRCRLHHGIQPERGQPVRVHDHHGPVLGACTGPGQGALHRDRAVAGVPRRVHLRRSGGDRRVELGFLHPRRVPGLHRDPVGPRGPRRGAGLSQQPRAAVPPPDAADQRGLRRPSAWSPESASAGCSRRW